MAGHKTAPSVELRLLRVFLAVSQSGSMTIAAKQLGLSQSAVSQSLHELEGSLKVSLFVREHRPLQMTAAGKLLQDRASSILEQAHQLPSLLQEIGSVVLPVIRIGLADSFAATVGPMLVRGLLQEAVQLSVYSGLSPSHGQALMKRDVDLIITSDPLYDFDGLERHLIFSEPFILILPSDLARSSLNLTIDQIAARHPFIRYSARSHLGTQIDRHLRRLGIQPPRVAEIDGSDTLVAMVASGCGWAITTPMCLMQGRLNAKSVVAPRLLGEDSGRSMFLIARSGEYAGLPRKVASQARAILQNYITPEICKMIPWLKEPVSIGS